MVAPAVLARLRCPLCGSALREGSPDALICEQGHAVAVRDGYIDASGGRTDPETERLFASFGYEHVRFDRLPEQDAAVWDRYFRDVPFDELRTGVALDAGTGTGRFSRFLAERMGAVVALDGSDGVLAAARNLAEFSNVGVVRADFRSAPLTPASFDLICCIGVLHHLEEPREAFDALVHLLAPGGRLLVFLYSRPPPNTIRAMVVGASAALRKLTVRLPGAVVQTLSLPVAAALYLGLVLPGRLGEAFGIGPLAALPLRMYRRLPPWSLWHNVFDVLKAPLERRYEWADVEPWYRGSGLEVEHVRDDDGLIILARRPTG